MKKITAILFLVLSLTAYSQEPTFKITSDVFQSLPYEMQNKLLPHLQYQSQHTIENNQPLISTEEQTMIKLWLGINPSIKIISRTYFNSLSQEHISVYDQPESVLIYEGSVLRYSDILNFEAQ